MNQQLNELMDTVAKSATDKKILSAVADCDRIIKKVSRISEDLRLTEDKKILDHAIKHREKLMAILSAR